MHADGRSEDYTLQHKLIINSFLVRSCYGNQSTPQPDWKRIFQHGILVLHCVSHCRSPEWYVYPLLHYLHHASAMLQALAIASGSDPISSIFLAKSTRSKMARRKCLSLGCCSSSIGRRKRLHYFTRCANLLGHL